MTCAINKKHTIDTIWNTWCSIQLTKFSLISLSSLLSFLNSIFTFVCLPNCQDKYALVAFCWRYSQPNVVLSVPTTLCGTSGLLVTDGQIHLIRIDLEFWAMNICCKVQSKVNSKQFCCSHNLTAFFFLLGVIICRTFCLAAIAGSRRTGTFTLSSHLQMTTYDAEIVLWSVESCRNVAMRFCILSHHN